MLYRFELELADVDRGVYESLNFRMAQHPSESAPYLMTRLLAYALNFEPGLEFSPAGLHDPDQPALRVPGPHGAVDLWIDVGNPSAARLHKASKAARRVVVYTYKRAATLLEQVDPRDVHRAADIRLFALEPEALDQLAARLEKTNRWALLHQQGRVDVTIGGETVATETKPFRLTEEPR